MSYYGSRDWLIEVAKGNIPGHSRIEKFGRNASVGTTYVPVALGGVYPMPQVGAATTLRIKAGGEPDDTAGGTGAQEITLEGLNSSGDLIQQTLETAGVDASSATSVALMRNFRAWVSKSGTYADMTEGSHAGDIVIEDSSSVGDWLTISTEAGDLAHGQSEVGCLSVAQGVTAYLLGPVVTTDASKKTKIVFFRRHSILQTSAPYDALRFIFGFQASGGQEDLPIRSGKKFIGPCDIGFMAKVDVGTAEVDVDFEVLLVED